MNAPFSHRWPRIVAEALRVEVRPLAPVAAAPHVVCAAEWRALVQHAGAPLRAQEEPPAILRPEQCDAWARVVAALDAYGGAVLAEPVGTGKTWIALALAARERRMAVVIVPALLRLQWESAATQAEVPLRFWTHERLSRGALPGGSPSLVIVDEAHRLRSAAIRRVRTLAPWLSGRRTLLLTATPIVNHLDDLITLLRLVLPEDALALDGIPRLGDIQALATPPSAVRRVAIRSSNSGIISFARHKIWLEPDESETVRGEKALAAVHQLRLSDSVAIRRLVRSILLDAAASSDAALHAALVRYHAMLLQARDAGGASRAMLRRFAGASLEQMVMWPLIEPEAAPGDLSLDDLPCTTRLVAGQPGLDLWADSLLARCRDGMPTVLFTRHHATARLLRQRAGDAAAWVQGGEGGVGPHRLPRHHVLAAFGPRRAAWRIRGLVPELLVATDVAAEGLDLQSAGRVVHVDLPWTAMRVDQREGRLLRLEQIHASVEIIIRRPAAAIQHALGPERRIHRKRRLSDEWLDGLAKTSQGNCRTATGTAAMVVTDDSPPGEIAAVEARHGRRTGFMLVARSEGTGWSDITGELDRLIARVSNAKVVEYDGEPPFLSAIAFDAVGYVLRRIGTPLPVSSPILIGRIQQMARLAAVARDGTALTQLDRLLRFIRAAPTLGDRLTFQHLEKLKDRDLLAATIPKQPAALPITARAVAVVLFRSPHPPLRCADAGY